MKDKFEINERKSDAREKDEKDEKKEKEENKQIKIEGTSNRYLMKRAMKVEKTVQIKKDTLHLCTPTNSDFTDENKDSLTGCCHENQAIYLNELTKNEEHGKNNKIDSNANLLHYIKRNVEKKINSYKQQDLQKGRFSQGQFISYLELLGKLKECQLQCHYCNETTHLYYDIVREIRQWTLDRIDNDLGHNLDNVVISCLGCNLKRRKTNQGAFLFTKQLNLVKMEE
jgi:hypothetical protein